MRIPAAIAITLGSVATPLLAQNRCGPIHYGPTTAGTGGVAPRVVASGDPLVGNVSFALRAESAAGGALVAQLLGLSRAALPAFGIQLLVQQGGVELAYASGAGSAEFPLPIPNDTNLIGLHIYSQVVTFDAGAATGLAASDGVQVRLCAGTQVCATSAYQGGQASDAFSAIHALGGGRIIAGKRSSQAGNRFLLSDDDGASWQAVACPGSTGAHTYFFGQNGDTVFSGTGDTGNACLMRSQDRGLTWTVALTSAQLRTLTGSSNVRSVFGCVHLGGGNWLVNLKVLDTSDNLIASNDNGASWFVPSAQPGTGNGAWARQMVVTSDGVLLWPSCLTDRMWRSDDQGNSWSSVVVPGASLFQPLCDAGNGTYVCGDASGSPNATLGLHRSLDGGLTWQTVTTVNLERLTPTYWRDVVAVDGTLLASACCHEGTSHEREMQLFRSVDGGATWCSYGNPYKGPYGGMQAIYQMCTSGGGIVFAACQPDSTILRFPVEALR